MNSSVSTSLDRGDIKLAYDRAVAHDVPDVAEMLTTFAEYIERLEKQRDELLAAVEKCRFALEPYDDIKPRAWKSDRENMRRAHQTA